MLFSLHLTFCIKQSSVHTAFYSRHTKTTTKTNIDTISSKTSWNQLLLIILSGKVCYGLFLCWTCMTTWPAQSLQGFTDDRIIYWTYLYCLSTSLLIQKYLMSKIQRNRLCYKNLHLQNSTGQQAELISYPAHQNNNKKYTHSIKNKMNVHQLINTLSLKRLIMHIIKIKLLVFVPKHKPDLNIFT